MPGGDSQILRAPYPKGEDGYVMLQSSALTLTAGGAIAAHIWDELTVPFAFQAFYAEVSAYSVTDASSPNDSSITVVDDSSSPQTIVATTLLTDAAAGSGGLNSALTAIRTVTVNAGAKLRFKYTCGASGDAVVALIVRLWVKPVN